MTNQELFAVYADLVDMQVQASHVGNCGLWVKSPMAQHAHGYFRGLHAGHWNTVQEAFESFMADRLAQVAVVP